MVRLDARRRHQAYDDGSYGFVTRLSDACRIAGFACSFARRATYPAYALNKRVQRRGGMYS